MVIFYCYDNKLTSLEYGPEKVDGYFGCINNQLTSLEYCPKYVGGNFYCYENNIPEEEIDRYRASGAVQGKIYSDYDRK